jgi:hypothetical protein
LLRRKKVSGRGGLDGETFDVVKGRAVKERMVKERGRRYFGWCTRQRREGRRRRSKGQQSVG